MSNEYLASEIIADMQDLGMIPPTDETFNTTRILKHMNNQLRLYMAELLRSVRKEYLVMDTDVSVASGTASYRISTKAIGSALRKVAMLDGGGNPQPLVEVKEEEREKWQNPGAAIAGYIFKGNSLELIPAPTASGTLRLSYEKRLNKLVDSSAVGEVTNINTGTKVVTCATVPSGFSTSTLLDLIQGVPHFDDLALDQAPTNVVTGASGTITFSALPSGLAVGDFVCLAGQTPIPQIPVELHQVLALRTALVILQALKHPSVPLVEKELAAARSAAISLIATRNEAADVYVMNYNQPGFRRGRFRWVSTT